MTGKKSVLPTGAQETSAGWVREMQEHFQQTGLYRAEDLQRVLGDPRHHSEISISQDAGFNFSHKK